MICSQCNEPKPDKEFRRKKPNPEYPERRFTECKDCRKAGRKPQLHTFLQKRPSRNARWNALVMDMTTRKWV